MFSQFSVPYFQDLLFFSTSSITHFFCFKSLLRLFFGFPYFFLIYQLCIQIALPTSWYRKGKNVKFELLKTEVKLVVFGVPASRWSSDKKWSCLVYDALFTGVWFGAVHKPASFGGVFLFV